MIAGLQILQHSSTLAISVSIPYNGGEFYYPFVGGVRNLRTGLFLMAQWYIAEIRIIGYTILANGISVSFFSHSKINAMCT
jgi:hypothetical protein